MEAVNRNCNEMTRSDQLKTVMENCERIPAETYQSKGDAGAHLTTHHAVGGVYLPPYDCDGHPIDDKDYNIPSPPERDCQVLSFAF